MGAVRSNSAGAGSHPAGRLGLVRGAGKPAARIAPMPAPDPVGLGCCGLRLAIPAAREWLARVPARRQCRLRPDRPRDRALSWQAAKAAARAAIRAIRWRQVALVASAPFVLPTEWRAALVRIFAYLGAIGALSLIAAEFVRQPETVGDAASPRRGRPGSRSTIHGRRSSCRPGFDEDDSIMPSAVIRRRRPQGHPVLRRTRQDAALHELRNLSRRRGDRRIRPRRRRDPRARQRAGPRARHAQRHADPDPSSVRSRPSNSAIGPFGGYNCIGFVRAFDEPRVQISGLSCNMNLLVDRSAISCALDRLTLMSAGSEPDIARLFAHAELKRTLLRPARSAAVRNAEAAGRRDEFGQARRRGCDCADDAQIAARYFRNGLGEPRPPAGAVGG